MSGQGMGRGIVLDKSTAATIKTANRILRDVQRATALIDMESVSRTLDSAGSVIRDHDEQQLKLLQGMSGACFTSAMSQAQSAFQLPDIAFKSAGRAFSEAMAWQKDLFEPKLPIWMFQPPFQQYLEQHRHWAKAMSAAIGAGASNSFSLSRYVEPLPTSSMTGQTIIRKRDPEVERQHHERPAATRGSTTNPEAREMSFVHARAEYAEQKGLNPEILDLIVERYIASPEEGRERIVPNGEQFKSDISSPMFISNGDYMDVRFHSESATYRLSLGMRYLKVLVENPEKNFSVIDLMEHAGSSRACEIESTPVNNYDLTAATNIEKEILDLERQLQLALDMGDSAKADGLDGQLKELMSFRHEYDDRRQLHSSNNPEMEKARKALMKCIKSEYIKLARDMPDLEDHLKSNVKTGFFCCYCPPKSTLH